MVEQITTETGSGSKTYTPNITAFTCKYHLPCGWCDLKNCMCTAFTITTPQITWGTINNPTCTVLKPDKENPYTFEG